MFETGSANIAKTRYRYITKFRFFLSLNFCSFYIFCTIRPKFWHIVVHLCCYFFVTSPQTLFGREVLFYSCESVILFVVLFVCLWFRDQDNSKSSRPISIKFGRTFSYTKNKVKFQFDKNCSGRTRTLSNRKFKIRITQKVIAQCLQNFTEKCVKSF